MKDINYNDYCKWAVNHKINGRFLTSSEINDYNEQVVTAGWQSPTVIENSPNFGVAIDIYSRLLQDRIIFIGTEIDDIVGNIVTSQILYLNSVNDDKPISIYLNTPGGSVNDGLSIYDTMMYVPNKIHTICTGIAASMGAVILAAGEYGQRFAQKHSRIMIHEVSSGQRGKMSDMRDSLRETEKLNKELFHILSLHTGHPVDIIEAVALRRDLWLNSEEAKKFGVIDNIFATKKEIKAPVHNYKINPKDLSHHQITDSLLDHLFNDEKQEVKETTPKKTKRSNIK